jgi:dimethylaniline monooxygenase (N-oxide forming)
MKNLLEVGFDVVGLDKHPYVGGLWNYNENKDAISVLPSALFPCLLGLFACYRSLQKA